MGAKLFLETSEPHRGILVVDQGDVVKVKATGSQSFDYNSNTFSGYLFVQKMPFIFTPLSVDRLLKEIDFTSIKHAKEVKDHIELIVPELKVTTERAIDKIVNEIEENKEQPSESVTVKEQPKQPEIKPELPAKTKEPLRQEKKGDIKVKDLKDLPKVYASLQGKEEKAPVIPAEKKADQKQEVWAGAIKVGTIGYFKAGYCIASIFKNKDNENEVCLYCSPKGYVRDGKEIESLPLITAKEGQAKFLLKALSEHPKFQLSINGFDLYRLVDFDVETLNSSAWLVQDPKTFVNASAKGIK